MKNNIEIVGATLVVAQNGMIAACAGEWHSPIYFAYL
jgi:hypothetical protein